jgi:beta-galactosidase
MRHIVFTFFLLCGLHQLMARPVSVAGFFSIPNSGRDVYNFNPGWRVQLGDVAGAQAVAFDDSRWEVVSLPHSVALVPAEASGGRNYQGMAWYRKRFVVPESATEKMVLLHFEAIMGKQLFYLNGRQIKEHRGGYLPVTLNLTEAGCLPGDTCLLAVMADNSNDKSYPPGKPQYTLDFAYHGGIYRDAWMIVKSRAAITDAIEANKVAGGGVFIHYGEISEQKAQLCIDTEVKNEHAQQRRFTLETVVRCQRGKLVATLKTPVKLQKNQSVTVKQQVTISNPERWSPETPVLYRVEIRLLENGKSIDGGMVRTGIRKAEFRGADGFYLNDQPYKPLIGGNRHQDFALIGNAMPNSLQWRDAKLLKDAGFNIIRTAHYPMDPAFMEACDELGLFVIVATPGWQYWNAAFEEQVHQNTRDIIRRDRNHSSVLLWEPILNETRFPLSFALKALEITREEFPWPGAPLAAGDMHSEGIAGHYGVVYGWPHDDPSQVKQSLFTREFGENVDDWYAHNANNRAARHWGEKPMKVAALSLADTYSTLFTGNRQFTGGTHWHPFDHQRGYHPDPYWGGIFDAFRQPKYSYYFFKSQTDARNEGKPMIYILNEMTPYSDSEVVVFTNCDSVRLTLNEGEKVKTLKVNKVTGKMPAPPLVFANMFDFWEMRELTYKQKKPELVSLKAEGFIDGQVVCTELRRPSRRSTKIQLTIDDQGQPLRADGSDIVVVIAEITDDNGNVRRLAKDNILFTVEGEATIVGNASIGANPRAVEFGSAPVLIRSTLTPGTIKIKAQVSYPGTHAPAPAEIEFRSVPAGMQFNYLETNNNQQKYYRQQIDENTQLSDEEKRKLLEEVERQQAEFGITN